MEYNKHKKLKLEWNLDNHVDTLIASAAQKKTLKLTKNGKSPGEKYINSELHKLAPEFRLRLLEFLNDLYKKCIPTESRDASVIPVLKKVTKETLKITQEKITQELVFLTPAIRYTLKSSI